MSRRALVLVLALAIDVILGEPPSRLHPVVWIGKSISWLESKAPRSGSGGQLAYGAGMAIGLPAVAGTVGILLDRLTSRLPIPLAFLLGALLLKPTFAGRDLLDHLERVRRPLSDGDLVAARGSLQMIVSRDTSRLDTPLVAAAAIESAAENASDSFVAPILYYSLFGPAGALAYRAVNTLDAMIGYHGRYEYLGKTAARLDDLANLVPSRLTALLIAVASPLGEGSFGRALRVARRDHGKTESPNAGWPMAAMAGALGVELEKVGHYRLGDPIEPVTPADLDRAVRITRGVLKGAAALGLALATVSERGAR